MGEVGMGLLEYLGMRKIKIGGGGGGGDELGRYVAQSSQDPNLRMSDHSLCACTVHPFPRCAFFLYFVRIL
jgi:hypothetical protein